MRNKSERGFSITEVLIVCVIIGIIAGIAVPHLRKGIRAAENGNMLATMRSLASTEMSYFSQNSRFGRLSEINTIMSGGLGVTGTNDLTRGKFLLTMTPPAPTDIELKQGYVITATRNITGEGVIYIYELTQTGEVRQVSP